MGKPNRELIAEMHSEGFITIAEAARIVRRSKWTVYYWVQHQIRWTEVTRRGSSWFVRRVAVKMFAHGRRAGGGGRP